MTWWCSATRQVWTWAPRAYPGIWLTMAVLVGVYVVATIRHARHHEVTRHERRKWLWFGLGRRRLVGCDGLAGGCVGRGLPRQRAHGAVPAVHPGRRSAPDARYAGMDGAPDRCPAEDSRRAACAGPAARRWCRVQRHPHRHARALDRRHVPLEPTRIDGARRRVVAVGLPVVDAARQSAQGAASSVTGGALHLPLPRGGAIAMVPGGILTFASFPLYRTYELAPRVWGLSADDDQQMAGILMKIGNIPVVWAVIFATFVKWAADEEARPRRKTPGPYRSVGSARSDAGRSDAERRAFGTRCRVVRRGLIRRGRAGLVTHAWAVVTTVATHAEGTSTRRRATGLDGGPCGLPLRIVELWPLRPIGPSVAVQ